MALVECQELGDKVSTEQREGTTLMLSDGLEAPSPSCRPLSINSSLSERSKASECPHCGMPNPSGEADGSKPDLGESRDELGKGFQQLGCVLTLLVT